jgi:hypothetical protein
MGLPSCPFTIERLCCKSLFVIASDPALAGERGNLSISGLFEIASVVSLPRNDIATQSPGGEG